MNPLDPIHEQLRAEIEERQRVEAELRECRERLDLLGQLATDGVWAWNVVTNEEYFSDRLGNLLGYAPGTLKAHFDVWASHLHPEDKERVFAAVKAHLEHRVPYDLEYRLRTATGAYRLFRASGQAQWDAAGQPQRMAGVITDITERRRMEAEREQLVQELQQTLEKVKTLRGFVPVCASCHKVRKDDGFWEQLVKFVTDRSEAQFSHTCCPDCLRRLYPEVADDVIAKMAAKRQGKAE